ncbi:ParB N-terminal domain-containing protein [Mesorhizobium sp. C416B]|uniref:ParB N-terminal domain-containing protein n=1 Tax=unclassified Mesorhizobium TaxID=325217 RepID=UPI0003CE7321|nr:MULTISPECIES: ParB N-terminal domain-containing protein [unclassified Mesorhizobium]ESX43553.1 transcriptional regulator [Mesorhizobium sp. LSHC426A00]ESX56736.1 transcriptional regulator [Mesorhizobium sp. LSHC422A00]WJI65513.1 ParB N-terminal domain-containing protein [Mesorhizobium sp. C416B]
MSGKAKLISNYTVVKLPVSQLRPSEEINIDRGGTLAKMIAEEGRWTRPILVEHRHLVIMDGHHRLFCAIRLGLSFVPCVLLSYDDKNLHVTSWYDSAPFAVDRIIQAGLSGNLMSFKMTRHKLQVALPNCSVDLDDLR